MKVKDYLLAMPIERISILQAAGILRPYTLRDLLVYLDFERTLNSPEFLDEVRRYGRRHTPIFECIAQRHGIPAARVWRIVDHMNDEIE